MPRRKIYSDPNTPALKMVMQAMLERHAGSKFGDA